VVPWKSLLPKQENKQDETIFIHVYLLKKIYYPQNISIYNSISADNLNYSCEGEVK